MKRILVLSDSHGNVNNMIYAVKETDPDMIIHLGDCWIFLWYELGQLWWGTGSCRN